jgi:broad specificity phosphatase PhoE
VESATLISRALGIPLQEDARLAEMSMGPWEGLTEAEVELTYPREYLIWNTTPARLEMKGRETLSVLASRVMEVVEEARRQTRPVLLMTHVAPMRVAALSVLGLDLNCYKRLHVPNAACLILDPQQVDLCRWPSGTSIRAELEREPRESDRTKVRPC